METARSWLRDNPSVRDDVMERFQADARLQKDALPDAVVADPALLMDLTKEILCEAVRRDAPEGVAEELLVAVRRLAAGVRDLSQYLRSVLKDLRGLRDRSELEPVLRNALDRGSDADRTKLQAMIEVVEKSELVTRGDEVLLADRSGFSPEHCAACCGIGCAECINGPCLLCCAVGCVLCGTETL